MTKRFYYPVENTDSLACDAQILDCRPVGEAYEVLLDATAIFPEGGGQLSDQGRLYALESGKEIACISHAREDGEKVWHLSDRPVEVGMRIRVQADEALRRDHSAQHSGEHILSGLASRLFGAKNGGFHMAQDYATLDLDIFLTDEQLGQLQLAANEAVQANLPTRVRVVDGAELAGMELRKKAAGLTGAVRIVYVGGVDSCTCCGTHVAFSGEVGYIRISSAAKYKGGTRVWFSCGMRAVGEAMEEKAVLDKLARRFSTKAADVAEAVIRQGDELAACKKELRCRTEALLSFRAEALLDEAEKMGEVRLASALLEGLDMAELKILAEKLCAMPGTLALLLSRKDGSLFYQLARAQGVQTSMKELCLALNGLAGGRGGGREDMAQGSATITGSLRPEDTLEQMQAYCRRALGSC
ncbi:MAG: alanyl-tRNA editing protein [Candidatus Pelethousia sp.]|nr:alanyl-tRNA editing protein [Candidatus Pelethousia sp.]